MSGIGQCITQIFGKTINRAFACHVTSIVFDIDFFGGKAILRAVCFVGDDDDVMAFGQRVIDIATVFWLEFLNGGKNDTARIDFK